MAIEESLYDISLQSVTWTSPNRKRTHVHARDIPSCHYVDNDMRRRVTLRL